MSSSFPPQSLTPEQLNYSDSAQWLRVLKAALMDLRVSIPAIVLSFNSTEQTVTVQIAVREIVKTSKGPSNVAIQPIYRVPVCFPSGGGYSLTLPLQPGDEGLLVFCDMCIDGWWTRGASTNPTSGLNTDPQNQLEQRRHDLTDCGFYPGGRSQPRSLNNYSGNSAQLRSDDGTVVVDVQSNAIVLTAPAISMNSSGNISISGAHVNINSSGNNTTIDGKTFRTHQHTGVQSGGSNTGPVL